LLLGNTSLYRLFHHFTLFYEANNTIGLYIPAISGKGVVWNLSMMGFMKELYPVSSFYALQIAMPFKGII